MRSYEPRWWDRLIAFLRDGVWYQFGKPQYPSQPEQWFIWFFGLFLEWNQDGWELSFYRSRGARCSWKWTHTRSGKPIQP